jgi:hypothetical protein
MNNCVYFHINVDKNIIFNVGIGNSKRPYSKHNRNKWWHNFVKKYDYNVIIVHTNLSWNEACELEKKYIAQIGRKDLKLGTLLNLTNGGDGGDTSSGKKHSNKTKKKMSESHLGEKNAFYGKKHSKKSIKKIVEKRKFQIIKKHSDKTKKKLSKIRKGDKNPFYGKKHSKNSIQKISLNSLGRLWFHNKELKISKLIKQNEVEKYLKENWTKGRFNNKL